MLNDAQRLDQLERDMKQMQKQMATMLNDWHRLIAMSNDTRPMGYGGMSNSPFGAGYYGGYNRSEHDLFTTFNPYLSAGGRGNPNAGFGQSHYRQKHHADNIVYLNVKDISLYFELEGAEGADDQFVKVIQTALLLCSGDLVATNAVFKGLHFAKKSDDDKAFFALFHALIELNGSVLTNSFLPLVNLNTFDWFVVDVLPSLQLTLVYGNNDQGLPSGTILVDLIPLINLLIVRPPARSFTQATIYKSDAEQQLMMKIRNVSDIVNDVTLEGVMERIVEKMYGAPSTDGTRYPGPYNRFLCRPELLDVFSQYR